MPLSIELQAVVRKPLSVPASMAYQSAGLPVPPHPRVEEVGKDNAFIFGLLSEEDINLPVFNDKRGTADVRSLGLYVQLVPRMPSC